MPLDYDPAELRAHTPTLAATDHDRLGERLMAKHDGDTDRMLAEAWAMGARVAVHQAAGVRCCRVCGCWQLDACPTRCWWVEEDLCSSCATPDANTAVEVEWAHGVSVAVSQQADVQIHFKREAGQVFAAVGVEPAAAVEIATQMVNAASTARGISSGAIARLQVPAPPTH